ncbi:MAG: VOC family protein [Candidatus Cloacimonadota bacterium]|nr:VOC family protein [Candidatus Cloacimonadota bacterium]
MLQHIGLNISDKSEIENFYKKLLGFQVVREFQIDSQLSQKIFGLEKDASVFLMQKDDLKLELFVNGANKQPHFGHICLEIPSREKICLSAQQKGYLVIRKQRPHSDLVFLQDGYGNLFELKEKL